MMFTISNLSKKCFGILIAALLCSVGSNAANQSQSQIQDYLEQMPKITKIINCNAPTESSRLVSCEQTTHKAFKCTVIETTTTKLINASVKNWQTGTETKKKYPLNKVTFCEREQRWIEDNSYAQKADKNFSQQESNCDVIARVMQTDAAEEMRNVKIKETIVLDNTEEVEDESITTTIREYVKTWETGEAQKPISYDNLVQQKACFN